MSLFNGVRVVFVYAKQHFPLCSWDQLKTQLAASSEIRNLWAMACRNYETIDHHDLGFRKEVFASENYTGYRAERPYRMMEEGEFQAKYKMKFKDVQG